MSSSSARKGCDVHGEEAVADAASIFYQVRLMMVSFNSRIVNFHHHRNSQSACGGFAPG